MPLACILRPKCRCRTKGFGLTYSSLVLTHAQFIAYYGVSGKGKVQVLPGVSKTTEGGTMRKLLLLAALCMLGMLALASTALAQQGLACPGNQVNVLRPSGEYICVPPNIDQQTPEQIQAVNEDPRPNAETPIVENQGIPAPGTLTPAQEAAQQGQTTSSTTPSVSCEEFVSAAGNPSQFQAQQFYDFEATPAQQAALDTDNDGFACDSLETSVDNLGIIDADRAAATTSAMTTAPAATTAATTPAATTTAAAPAASALPDTGGPMLLLPVAALLLGSGLLVLRLVRRNS